MRYITIPGPVSFTLPETAVAEFDFVKHFIVALVLPRVARATASDAQSLMGLCSKLPNAAPGDVIALTDAEHEALARALPREPESLRADVLIHIPHFFFAILGAPAQAT